MSSQYQAELLSRKVIKSVLNELSKVARKSLRSLLEEYDSSYSGENRAVLRKTVNYLRDRGYIKSDYSSRQNPNYTITTKGERRLYKLTFNELSLSDEDSWDGKWRVLVFDIPEQNRRVRNALRGLIRQMGFSLYQNSVWVHPLPCRKQVEAIKSAYGVKKHICLLEVTDIDGESNLRKKHFKHTNTTKNDDRRLK